MPSFYLTIVELPIDQKDKKIDVDSADTIKDPHRRNAFILLLEQICEFNPLGLVRGLAHEGCRDDKDTRLIARNLNLDELQPGS